MELYQESYELKVLIFVGCSPQFPTPRRALFTTNAIMGALEGKRKDRYRNIYWGQYGN